MFLPSHFHPSAARGWGAGAAPHSGTRLGPESGPGDWIHKGLGPPAALGPFCFFGEGEPLQKKVGALVLTSLLEELEGLEDD